MSTSDGASRGGLSLLNGTMPESSKHTERTPALDFVDYCLRGVGQVCFMNNPITGLAILVGMFVAEAWLGFAGALGLVVSTLTAIVIGMDRGAPGQAPWVQRCARRCGAVAVSCSPTETSS